MSARRAPLRSRRRFLKQAAATAGVATSFTIAGTQSTGAVLGANDKVRVAVAGINGRGVSHMKGFASGPSQVTHLVDPDSRLFPSRSKMIEQLGGNRPKTMQDIREALDDKDLDAVSIATTNHWHSLITVWACQAGKDVYVEKPCSHNVFEGRQCVRAARKYKRVVQHGTQQRSSQGRANEIAALRSGKYGKLLVAKGYCCKPRWSIGFKDATEPPEGFDYNLWLGPAPDQPYHANLVHYNWHWFWDTGNGDMGNQGVHEMDVARWGTGKTLPKRVWSAGGRWVPGDGFKDQAETPNMLLSVYDYGDVKIVFETRGLVGRDPKFPRKVANEFYTDEGVVVNGKFTPNKGGKTYDVDVEPVEVISGGPFGSFIKAVQERRLDDNNADIEVGHYSSALCHLGNISYRVGKQVPFSDAPPQLSDDDHSQASWDVIKANLQGVLDMDLGKQTYQLGPVLDFDAQREQFTSGPSETNDLLTRDYREPFVVPEQV